MSGRIESVPAAPGRDWPTIIALGLLVAAFGAGAGPIGVLGGLATALIGVVLGPPYVLAVGHVALVACFPDGIDLVPVAGIEAAFGAVVLASLRRSTRPGRVGTVAIVSAFSLAAAAWYVTRPQATWLAAVAVLGLFAGATYGCHRLALVRLGLVSTSDDASTADTEPTYEHET
ncbi:hypothetical protein [Natrinema sp. 1APR25-10V2]|uniref:hypothetical protein n=1 Tax=Natrinema sp. 1APR25-10V2 TaxID=2951081 RepID=UPI00287566CB|nr:hypothetical protein [Natrinema sp. 1APR25-10V2]MDS0475728.1 hypothetical protein [Natrinema sp. 1APR25-10V2]